MEMPKRGLKLNSKQINLILDLKSKDMHVEKIAKRIGCSKKTVYNYLKRFQ